MRRLEGQVQKCLLLLRLDLLGLLVLFVLVLVVLVGEETGEERSGGALESAGIPGIPEFAWNLGSPGSLGSPGIPENFGK